MPLKLENDQKKKKLLKPSKIAEYSQTIKWPKYPQI